MIVANQQVLWEYAAGRAPGFAPHSAARSYAVLSRSAAMAITLSAASDVNPPSGCETDAGQQQLRPTCIPRRDAKQRSSKTPSSEATIMSGRGGAPVREPSGFLCP